MDNPKRIEVERLCDLDDWEFYSFVEVGFEGTVRTVGLRHHSEMRQVEYEVWIGDNEYPYLMECVDCDDLGERWTEEVRDRILSGIIARRQ